MDSLFRITVSVDESSYNSAVEKLTGLGKQADTIASQFIALGKSGTDTFVKIGAEVSSVTKRLVGQRQSVEALIRSYQKLASVNKGVSAVSPSKSIFPHELYGIPGLQKYQQANRLTQRDVMKASQGYDWRFSGLSAFTSEQEDITQSTLQQIFAGQKIAAIKASDQNKYGKLLRERGLETAYNVGFKGFNLPIYGFSDRTSFGKKYNFDESEIEGIGGVFEQNSVREAGIRKVIGQEIGTQFPKKPEMLYHEIGHFVANQFLTPKEIQAVYSRSLKSINKGAYWIKPSDDIGDVSEIFADYFAGMTRHAVKNPMFMRYLKQDQPLEDPVHRVFQEMFTGKLWGRPRELDIDKQFGKFSEAYKKTDPLLIKKAEATAKFQKTGFQNFMKSRVGDEGFSSMEQFYGEISNYLKETQKIQQFAKIPEDTVLREAIKKTQKAREAQGIDTEEMRRVYAKAAEEKKLGSRMEEARKKIVPEAMPKTEIADEESRRKRIVSAYERQLAIEKEMARTKSERRKAEVAELTDYGRKTDQIDIDKMAQKHGVSSKTIQKDVDAIGQRWKAVDDAIVSYDKHQQGLVQKAAAYKESVKPLDQQTFQTQQKMQKKIDEQWAAYENEQAAMAAKQEAALKKARQPKWLTKRQDQVADIEKGLKETLDRGMMGYTQEKQHAVLSKRAQTLREEMDGFTGKRSDFARQHGTALKNLTNDYNNFNNSIGGVNRTMAGGMGFWEKWGVRMSGIAATLFVWQEILQRIRAVVALARQYEDAVRQTAVQTGTQAFMPQYEKEFETTMLETGKPVDKIAEATQALMDLGLSPNEALKRLGDTLEIAKNKSIKMADAAQIAAFNTWGLRDAILEANKVAETGGERAWGQFTNQLQLIAKEFTRDFEPKFVTQLNSLSQWLIENKDSVISGFEGITTAVGALALGIIKVGQGIVLFNEAFGTGFFDKVMKKAYEGTDREKGRLPLRSDQNKDVIAVSERTAYLKKQEDRIKAEISKITKPDMRGTIAYQKIFSDEDVKRINSLGQELKNVQTELRGVGKEAEAAGNKMQLLDPQKIAAAWQSMWTLLNQPGPKIEIDVGLNIPGITDDGKMNVEQGMQERIKQMVQQYSTNMKVEGIGEPFARKMLEQQLFQLRNVEMKAPSQKAYGEMFGMAGVAPKDFWITQKAQMANEIENAPISPENKISIMSLFNFELDQKRLAPIMASWKEILDKLGAMGTQYYGNELLKIEHERIKMIGQGIDEELANRLAQQAKVALEWEKKIADETKVTPEQRKHFETMFQETKMYPDRFREYERMMISMTAGKIKSFTGDEEGANYYEQKKVFEQTYEKMAARQVEIGEAMYNELGLLEESYYDLLKRKAEDRERLLVNGGMPTARAAEIRAKEELDLEERKNKNILDAWEKLQSSLGFVSQDYLDKQETKYQQMAQRLKTLLPESEQGNIGKMVSMARYDDQARALKQAADAYRDLEQNGVMVMEQFRLEHEALNKELEKWIELLGDAEKAQLAYNHALANLDARQLRLSQDAIDGVRLRLAQAALETNTIAEEVAGAIRTMTSGFEAGIQEGFIDVVNGDFEDAVENMVKTWKRAIDQMAADFVAKQFANLVFGQLAPTPGSTYGGSSGQLTGVAGLIAGLFGSAGPEQLSGPGMESGGGSWWESIATIFSAKGNIFDPSGLKTFGDGGLVTRPTVFPFNNGVGLMGEAGTEAIMPLKRLPNGKLGVETNSGGNSPTININVQAPRGRLDRQSLSDIQASTYAAMTRAARRNT